MTPLVTFVVGISLVAAALLAALALAAAHRNDNYADLDDVDLDPGIGRTVCWLRAHFFETTDSGDGESKFAQGWSRATDGADPLSCALSEPHVFIRVDARRLTTECRRLATLLEQQGVPISSVGLGPFVQGTYDPTDGSAIISLIGVNDAMLFPAAC